MNIPPPLPRKQAAIDAELRDRIVRGIYRPGQLVPRRVDLEIEFATSRATMQQVFDRLLADGFISTNGRGGTVVADRPPFLRRIALVFSDAPTTWNRFWIALDNEARAMIRSGERELVIHTGIDVGRDSAAAQSLLADVRARRLAGIIFAASPTALVGDEILDADLARVAIMDGPGPVGTPAVYPDFESFIVRALSHLVACGRKRVAVLSVPGFPVEVLRREMARIGVEAMPHLLQTVPHEMPAAARALTQLLFHADQRRRPDALLITDDNLVEHGLAGLLDAGVRVPKDVSVVTHCNFPWPAPSVLPARRLGFDAGEVLRTCLALLDQHRAGRHVAAANRISARFEDDGPIRAVVTPA